MALFRSIGAALDDDGTGTEPIDVRKGLAGLLSGPGVLPGAASPLVQGTGGFEYQVNAAHWVTSRGGSDGLHLWGNDGPITVPTDVAPGAGLSRIDVIYALHPSNGENADTSSQPVVAVAKGVAASTPIAPTIPTGALELARNTMSSGASDTAGAGNAITQTASPATVVGTGLRRIARSRTTASIIPNSEFTTIGSWNESVSATGLPVSDITSGGSSYTVNFTGWVRVRVRLAYATNSTGIRIARVVRDGVALVTSRAQALTSNATDVSAEWEGPVAPGQIFTAQGFQNSGGSLALEVSGSASLFAIERTA